MLKKSAASELFKALQKVLLGQVYITPLICLEPVSIFVARARKAESCHSFSVRQREILAAGRSMKEAANLLNVATRTIAFHEYAMKRRGVADCQSAMQPTDQARTSPAGHRSEY